MPRSLLALLLFLPFQPLARAQHPTLPDADRIRIAEAFRLAEAVQESVWTGWSTAPFALLLVTTEHEFLVRHPHPSDSFTRVTYDSLLHSDVYVRERVFQPDLLASFPVDGVPAVVIGSPDQTGRPSSRWVLTVMHEHFHQLQYSQPDYYPGLTALDLARGDQSGMWVLNYAFPYDSTAIVEHYGTVARAALEAVQARGTSPFDTALATYRSARDQLRALLNEDDYKYLSLQLWQEGVARYIEYKTAAAAVRYTPTPAFEALDDYRPFEEVRQSLVADFLNELDELTLDQYRRVAFYAVGAAEALLLDQTTPDWHRRYFEDMFSLDTYREAH